MRPLRQLRILVISVIVAAYPAQYAVSQDVETIANDSGVKASDRHELVKKRAPKVVQQYPDATRHEPELKPTAGMSKDIAELHSLVDAKNNDAAIALGEKMLADHSANHFDRAVAFQGIGYANFGKRDYAKAAEQLQNCINENAFTNNDHYQTMLNLAQVQINAGQSDAGLATLDRLVSETKLDKPEYAGIRGRAFYAQKNYSAAAQALQKAVDSAAQPDDNAQRMLMASYFNIQQPERAEKIALNLLQAHPGDKDLILNLASIYGQAGQNDKAAAMLEDARNRGLLTDTKDYRTLFVIYANLPGKERQTIEVINEGLQKQILQPSAEVYSALAQSYYATNQPAQTIDAYRKADSLSSDGEAALNLARVLFNEHRYPEARTAVGQAQQKGLKRPADAKALLAQIDSAGGESANKVTKKKK